MLSIGMSMTCCFAENSPTADLRLAERLAGVGRNRSAVQGLYGLRGRWHMTHSEHGPAVSSLREAVRMAREVGEENTTACALLAVARLRLGENFDAAAEAERLGEREPGSVAVAELWGELGERDKAIAQALRAHTWAVADGEPYVFRDELDRARNLLTKLGEPLPEVPRHDPTKAEVFPWEAEVRSMIDKLNAEGAKKTKAARKTKKTKKVKGLRRKKPAASNESIV